MVIFPTVTHSVGSYLGPKGEELKCTLHSEEQCEHPVEVAQDFSEVKWSSMKLKLDKMVNLDQPWPFCSSQGSVRREIDSF